MTPGGSPIFFRAPVDAIFQRIMAEDYDVERKGRYTFVKCGGPCILLVRTRGQPSKWSTRVEHVSSAYIRLKNGG